MDAGDNAAAGAEGRPLVRNFRQILLWPLQLAPQRRGGASLHWEQLRALCGDGAPLWREVTDVFPDDTAAFQERHYREFVTFLPYVQRLIYGQRGGRGGFGYGDSPIRVFRRSGLRAMRVTLRPGAAPVTLAVTHADLYFFYDVDVVVLALETSAENLPLDAALDLMFRVGRAYPSGWSEGGQGANCPALVEWLDADGAVLARSDYEDREKYLRSVCTRQAPTFSRHWEWLLEPMVLDHSERPGALRYRQLEYHRMPTMAWLAVDDPSLLTRADYVRLAFLTPAAGADELPYSPAFLGDFEQRYCYDRYHDPHRGGGWSSARILCSGHAFVMVGDARSAFFTDRERGILAQFRHQFFMLGLIAHFHKAALLMLSDRLVETSNQLEIDRPETIRAFRRSIRETMEIFLRFTHRYWFSEVSDQAVARDVFRMWSDHLKTEPLYAELRAELQDMSNYLDSDLLRRQAVTILQLTVVTLISIIGTVSTGFLGMNLIAYAEAPLSERVLFFFGVLIPTTALTLFTVMKSRRVAVFLDLLGDERATWGQRLAALGDVFRPKRDAPAPPRKKA